MENGSTMGKWKFRHAALWSFPSVKHPIITRHRQFVFVPKITIIARWQAKKRISLSLSPPLFLSLSLRLSVCFSVSYNNYHFYYKYVWDVVKTEIVFKKNKQRFASDKWRINNTRVVYSVDKNSIFPRDPFIRCGSTKIPADVSYGATRCAPSRPVCTAEIFATSYHAPTIATSRQRAQCEKKIREEHVVKHVATASKWGRGMVLGMRMST